MIHQKVRNILITTIALLTILVVIVTIINTNNPRSDDSFQTPAFGINEKVAFIISQNIILDSFKLNWSAKFPTTDYSYKYLGSNTYSIQSYVDYINDLGVKKRNNYFIELQYISGAPSNTHNWKPLYLSVEPTPQHFPQITNK